MIETVSAAASPEKRLFVYLITRDISLADAILDLIDNSINAALQPLAEHLNTADDYQQLLARTDLEPNVRVDLKVGAARILVNDTAQGIPLEQAQHDVFRFGRRENGEHASDRLSVYGIGLKRAMFKCGNKIHMVSEHRDGGFALRLNARRWEQLVQDQWQFDIIPRKPAKTDFGTKILITELHDDVVRRLQDGLFIGQLRERIARTYSFFIGRVVAISLNGDDIESESFEIGENYTSEKFTKGKVSCSVTAGLASSKGKVFREKNSGWHVFCNGAHGTICRQVSCYGVGQRSRNFSTKTPSVSWHSVFRFAGSRSTAVDNHKGRGQRGGCCLATG